MPELPEVETIRRQLALKLIGKKLKGKKIVNLRRRAKILIIDFEDGSSLIFHLKMTGQLILNGKPSKHTRKVFIFNDGSSLIFNDLRKFGWWKKIKDTKELEEKFGPEALKIKLQEFKNRLKKRPGSRIKNLLMDQGFIAGIGNIYADEILFASRVSPLRRIKDLKEKEAEIIYKNIKKILKKAIIYRGSSVGDYFDAFGQSGNYAKYHKVYQKQGEKCPYCEKEIKRIKIGSRSAHYCPKCQNL